MTVPGFPAQPDKLSPFYSSVWFFN